MWISVSRTCTLEFKLSTYLEKEGDGVTLLSNELTGEIVFIADSPKLVNIDAIYSELGNTELKANAGDIFIKSLTVTTTESDETVIDIFSNTIYPSTFNLQAQSLTFDINTVSGLKSINILTDDWTDNGDGTYNVEIPQTQHEQAPSANYILILQELVSANTYQRIAFTPEIDTDGNITITSYEAVDCVLLIGSSVTSEDKSIITLTNPISLPDIDYLQYGSLKIVQTETATPLTLPDPMDVSRFYTFFVSNPSTNTHDIICNGEEISAGSGVQFKWNGSEWVVGEQPTDTDEVYDKNKSQLLSTTLSDLETSISDEETARINADNT